MISQISRTTVDFQKNARLEGCEVQGSFQWGDEREVAGAAVGVVLG